jgi:hypothetical protein
VCRSRLASKAIVFRPQHAGDLRWREPTPDAVQLALGLQRDPDPVQRQTGAPHVAHIVQETGWRFLQAKGIELIAVEIT